MSTKQRFLIIFLLALFPLSWFLSGYLVDQLGAVKSVSGPTHRWYKGNTHTHTLWSDGNDFPESIMHYYKSNGYQFLVLTDHNILSRGEKWMKVDEINRRRDTLGHPTLEKYRALFGEEWVETRMVPVEPAKVDAVAPEEDGEEVKTEVEQVRIKALAEVRGKFEEEEQFLLIEGEEITDNYQGPAKKHEVHMNAVNLGELIQPLGGGSVSEVIANNLRAIREQEERLKRPILEHLNHPNFVWSIVPSDIAKVIDLRFFEVYNGHPSINHLGRPGSADGTGAAAVPGDEEIWDIVNTIRIRDLKVKPLLGVATDDSHHYHGGDSSPGRGWVMVYAKKLVADDLIAAMRDGDFYASSGVTLDLLHDDSESLRVDIEPQEGVSYITEFIGTREDSDPSGTGEVLAKYEGTKALYQFSGDELFVRARVTSSLDHPNPSYPEQKQQAWTQPVGWRAHLPSQPDAETQ